MQTPTQLELEARQQVTVARLTGEIDLANAASLGTTLAGAVTNTAPGLVVDLSAVSYFDSAGIRLLFDLAGRLSGRGQRLHAVVDPSSRIAYMLSIVDLETIVPCHPTVEAAVAGLRDDPGPGADT